MNTTYFLNCLAGNIYHTKSTPAIPAKYYLGLSSTAPDLSGGNVTEPASSGGYARIEITSLSEPSDGAVSNTSPVSFAESTADWGTITHYVIYDAQTNGNLLVYGALSAPRSVESATVMTIKEGQLVLSTKNPTA